MYGLMFGSLLAGQTGVAPPRVPVHLMEALRSTLEKHPAIQIQQEQVYFNRGALRSISGQFDTLLTASMLQNHVNTPLTDRQQTQYAQLGLATSSLASNSTNYVAGAQKLFRNGISIGPSITLDRNTDNIATQEGVNQAQLGFQIVLPLLRGRGRAVVTAQEQSAESSVDASLRDVNQTIAQLLTTTAIQYWNAVGAGRNLEILTGSAERGENYVRDVQTLIDADRVPRAEIHQLQANLAGRTAARIQAEQGVISAQQGLAQAMGLTPSEMEIQPSASDSLPDWPERPAPEITPQLIHDFVDRALARRADLIAANYRRQAAEKLLPGARDQLRPKLNLNVSTGYIGLLEGTKYLKVFGSPFYNVNGITTTASLNYTFAPRTNQAMGQVAQVEASYRQAVLNQSDLSRTIASSVISAMTSLVNSINGLRKARESVTAYRLALSDQQEKFRIGLGSLVDILTIEDRLTAALSAELSAQLNYATALENLRFATGTVIDPNAQVHTLDEDTFLRPPFEWK
jgi:outer membrane protein TolC